VLLVSNTSLDRVQIGRIAHFFVHHAKRGEHEVERGRLALNQRRSGASTPLNCTWRKNALIEIRLATAPRVVVAVISKAFVRRENFDHVAARRICVGVGVYKIIHFQIVQHAAQAHDFQRERVH
jgi:hypothetical protein